MKELEGGNLSPLVGIDGSLFKIEEVIKNLLRVLPFSVPGKPRELFGDLVMGERKDHIAQIIKDDFSGSNPFGCVAGLS
jgi:hypothetical protein